LEAPSGGAFAEEIAKGGAVETIFARCAGLDVHKAQVTACVRVPDAAGGREQQLAEFPTTVRGVVALRDWLEAHRVTRVAMEATGVFGKPVWAILEDAFELTLCNARHVKQVPGRKTDVSDAAWLCQLMEAGLLRASFVPPKRTPPAADALAAPRINTTGPDTHLMRGPAAARCRAATPSL
jgi:hypothetical protein